METTKNAAEHSEQQSPYRIKRYYAYVVATLIAWSLPFISINGNHVFLLSFDKKQLHLMGIAFDMQELYLMPFLLMLLFLGIFAVTTLGGRAWCGWACPQTVFRVIYRDYIEGKLLGLRRIKNKQKEPDWSKAENKAKRVVAILIWTALSLVAAADFMWFFVPPEDFFAYLANPTEHMTMIGFVVGVAAFLVYDVIWLQEDFCVYICPYSRVQSVLYDDDTYQAIYSVNRGGKIYDDHKNKLVFKAKDLPDAANECTACESCVTVCPTHIDIRKGMQLECINCLECVDACTSVMGKLGKPSLVQWGSTKEVYQNEKTAWVRKKSVMYAIALSLILVALVLMSGTKEYMLLNVNKTTQLYKINEDKSVVNNYLFLFQNTEDKPHTYKLEVLNHPDITIERFEPFTLSPHKMAKKVVIFKTTKMLVNDASKDTPIAIKVKATSLEEPEKVTVLRDVVFIFPRSDKLK